MRLSQIPKAVATFDKTNLIPSAGLVPMMRLARRAGLGALVTAKLTLPGRHHAVFTNLTEPMLPAEAHHRDHAIVEQVIADPRSSAIAHFPSFRMDAYAAWLTCAVIAYNLARAAGCWPAGNCARRARPPSGPC